jgi:hypothetical protein
LKRTHGINGIIFPHEIKESIAAAGLESNAFELSKLQEVMGEVVLEYAMGKIPNPEVSGGQIVVVIGVTAATLVFKSQRVVVPSEPVPSSSARLKCEYKI